jgi:hypothetical protein
LEPPPAPPLAGAAGDNRDDDTGAAAAAAAAPALPPPPTLAPAPAPAPDDLPLALVPSPEPAPAPTYLALAPLEPAAGEDLLAPYSQPRTAVVGGDGGAPVWQSVVGEGHHLGHLVHPKKPFILSPSFSFSHFWQTQRIPIPTLELRHRGWHHHYAEARERADIVSNSTAMPTNQDYIAAYVREAPGYVNLITPFTEMQSELLMPYSDYRGYGVPRWGLYKLMKSVKPTA